MNPTGAGGASGAMSMAGSDAGQPVTPADGGAQSDASAEASASEAAAPDGGSTDGGAVEADSPDVAVPDAAPTVLSTELCPPNLAKLERVIRSRCAGCVRFR